MLKHFKAMEQQLYLLPFDHRRSFIKLIGAAEPLKKNDAFKIKRYKQLIYSAFKLALAQGLLPQKAGILVDEAYGREILVDARKRGFIICYPLEKSGQSEFTFDRADYKKRLQLFKPTYAKVLIRYNPEGDKALNKRQARRLAALTSYLERQSIGFLLEVLVPATARQAKKKNYDSSYRPSLTAKAIQELQAAGVNPNIWKLEGMNRQSDLKRLARLIGPSSRIIILGRGENKKKADRWLKVGAKVKKVIGFAVGRTVFQRPLLDYHYHKINKRQAIKGIMENYLHFVKVFENHKN